MGIDIGGLENVFMRNVPPTPANYVQRAGRAGRRKDSSAYVLTYCGTSSHDYTYFVEGATSDATYCECSFKSGTEYVTFHIGEDEQGKNVFFHFYGNDERLASTDAHDCVEVYVQDIKPVNTTLPVTLAKGKTGSLVQNGKISMLYNEKGVAMASFSLTKGKGVMASFAQNGVVSNGASYFSVTTSDKNATPVISESDKAVMLANGYAGVCIDGKYVNWP